MLNLNGIQSCKNCVFGEKNCQKDASDNGCKHFTPIDPDEYSECIMTILRDNNMPTNDHRLRRTYIKSRFAHDDNIRTQDEYYVKYINDVLFCIRHKKYDFCYSISQLEELMRFEPDLEAIFTDGCWMVSLPEPEKLNNMTARLRRGE